MKKKNERKIGIVVIAFMALMVTLAFAGPASADTIYVPTDYPTIQQAIDAANPGDTVFVWNGTYYEGNGVNISEDRITLQGEDANTTTIHGMWTAEKVVNVSGDYVSVSGLMVTGSSRSGSGIYLSGSCNCRLSQNNATDNNYGIWLDSSSNNNLTGNSANNNHNGIYLDSSSNNNLTGNSANNNNDYGIYLDSSSNNNLTGNSANYNDYYGIYLDSSSDNSLTGNSANYNYCFYGIWLRFSCNNNIIANNTVSNNIGGISLYSSSNNTITNNTISSNNWCGIYLDSSSNNTIANNTFLLNGMFVYDSYNNKVTNNTVNGKPLVYLENVNDYVVKDAGQVIVVNSNNITVKNSNLSYANVGMEFWNTTNSKIINNTVSKNNWDGIRLYSSSNNTIANNTVSSNNDDGFVLGSSSNNKIYLNNFINNTDQIGSYYSTNIWNSTEKISYFYNGSEFKDYLGNYWSDYTDKYPDAEEIDSTGIWDTPYSIDSDEDNYPLMNPFENYISEQKPDLTITNISWNPSNPKTGDEVFFNYTIKNHGDANTTDFTTALYIDDERFDISARTSLEAGETQERFFTRKWIATAGNHSIKVVADDLGEIDESDEGNNETMKWLNVAPLFNVLYEDGFDTCDIGIFPPGWGKVYSGRGWNYCEIDNSQAFSSPNSWKLEGARSWSQCVGRRIPNPLDQSQVYDYNNGLPSSEYAETVAWLEEHPQIWFEVMVMTAEKPGSFVSDGGIAHMNFYKVLPRWGRGYGGVGFRWNTSLGYFISGGRKSMPYEPYHWYKVKVYTDLTARRQTIWINDTILSENASVGVDVNDWPEMLLLAADNGGSYTKVWFDDVKIGYGLSPTELKVHNLNTGEDFATIQAAIYDSDTKDGHTIIVDSGTYRENVVVNKSINLTGIGYPVVDAGGSGNAITVTADGCTIDGFEVINSVNGLYLLNSDNNNITDIIALSNDNGISLASSNNSILENNTLLNNSNGIYLHANSGYNQITNNTAKANNRGIALADAYNNMLKENILLNSSADGIYLHANSRYNQIINNTALNNNRGIALADAHSNNLNANILSNNTADGIYLHANSSYNAIANNTAKANGRGIALADAHNNILSNNNASNNTIDGIYLFNSIHNQITLNTANLNQYRGFVMTTASNHNTATKNTAYSNVLDGFGISWSNANILLDNEVSNNSAGIVLIASNDNRLNRNTITKSKNAGISLSSSSNNNTFVENSVSNNSVGIFLSSSDDNTLANNNITFNKFNGIVCEHSSPTIIWNYIAENGNGSAYQSGIRCIFNSSPDIIDNLITANKNWGIYCYVFSSPNITNNTITFNDHGIQCDDRVHPVIYGNNISYNNLGVGFHCAGADILNNMISHSGYEGISAGGEREHLKFTISNNQIVFNNRTGISTTNSSLNITNNNISFNEDNGIHCELSSNTSIENNTINSNGADGVYLYLSYNNTITNNNANSNNKNGIYLSQSNNNTIKCNIANLNDYKCGILIHTSNNNRVIDNIVSSNFDAGVYLLSSYDNKITDNNISSNLNGIYVYSDSDNNVIMNNNVSKNENGIVLHASSGNNLICHNNLINNTNQAFDNTGTNFWDNGPIVGGNYWSDHICDGNPSNGSQPYNISGGAGAQDRYPFENPNGWLGEGNDIDSIMSGAKLVEKVSLNATVDISAVVNDTNGSIIGDYVVWEEPLTNYNNYGGPNPSSPNHHGDGLPSSVNLRYAINSKGDFYAGAIGPDTDALAVVAAPAFECLSYGSGEPSPPYISAFLQQDLKVNVLGKALWTQYNSIEDDISNGPEDIPDFINRSFALKNNYAKPLYVVFSALLSGDGYYNRNFFKAASDIWCPFSNYDETGSAKRSFNLRYVNPCNSYVTGLAYCDNGNTATVKLEGTTFAYQDRCCANVTRQGDSYPASVTLELTLTWSISRPVFSMAIVADDVTASNPNEWANGVQNPSDSLSQNPEPWILKINPGWNGEENEPPIASFTYSPENPVVNQMITFNASPSYDPDGNITNYEWDFGDGTNGTGKITSHSYPNAGAYAVTLTVKDDDGAINMTSDNVSVLVDPSPLISEVNSICDLGVPGPLFALNTTAVPVVSGDNDTTPIPSVVVMASGSGSGRVVALGHEGFLTNEALELFDNKRFGDNIVDWLDKLGKRKILVTTGHGEWYGGSNFDNFKAELESCGYEVVRFSGTITPSVLSDVGVVLIGTAWGNVSDSEIDALTNFVSNGGGLLLTGLGWSYKGYVGPLDEYPMNKIAEPYGIRWIDGYIIDPTDDYEGGVIFHTFYPNIEVQTIYQAFSYIENTTDTHPSDLSSFLQTNETARRKYTNAHLLIATATRELNQLSPQRQEIYDFYKNLINTYPRYFRKEVVYDKATESTMAWIRERVYRSFIDALPLTDTRKSEIASTIGLYDQYLDIWTDSTVLLLDNTCLTEKQKDFIYTYLNLLPGGIHNLRSISVADYLGHTSPEVPLWGQEGGVNIFGVDIGGYSENSFPDDVPPGMVDGFCIVVAHEINHVVDAFYIQSNNTLRDRKDKLIADAGDEHLNYLRSMFPDGFFQQYPQEFFASIANQWFTDSKKTIELGIVRFDNVSKHPINQALFFADVYSLGRNFTYFYTIDTQGNITRHKIPLSRDANSRINSLTIGNLVYTFTLDANGDVTAYSIQPVENKPPVASFTHSPANPLANQTLTFDASNSTDPDGNIENYEWDFGDGNTTSTTEPIITHSYTIAGNYNVNLTVTDNDGAANSTSKTITISIPLKGDLDGDNQITSTDAAIALNFAVRGEYDTAADVSGDGRVTSLDALIILQMAAA